MRHVNKLAYFTKSMVSSAMALMILASTCPPIAFADHCSMKSAGNSANGTTRASVDNLTLSKNNPESKPVNVKTGPREVHKFDAKVSLPANPTDLDLTSAHLLSEPLVPMNDAITASENADLGRALLAFKSKHSEENLGDIEQFVHDYPKSRWLSSLQLNMALMSFRTGRLSVALKLFSSVWMQTKSETKPTRKVVADRAVAMLCLINARLGRQSVVRSLFKEIKGRPLFGSDEQMIKGAEIGLAMMQTSPQTSFKCGPYAVGNLLTKEQAGAMGKVIENAKSTQAGTNLVQVNELAKQTGLKMQMAKKSPGAALVLPSIMHWKLDHFSALTEKDNDVVILKDPTFGTNTVFGATEKTLDSETDGYFLIPASSRLPEGWTLVSAEEGKKVWGKGSTLWPNMNDMRDPAPRSPCWKCGCIGMAHSSMWKENTSLNIMDIPLFYSPPLGDPINFKVNYNQEEANQPGTFTFTNLGLNWSFFYCSYLTVGTGSVLTVRVPGGGAEVATLSGGVYTPDQMTQAQMVNTGSAYERHMPDGSFQVYDQTDTNGNWFMTKMTDAQGNSVLIQYDANFRITGITDAIGQVSTLAYVSNTVGNSGFYKLASITDPFSRSCSFSYDSTHTNLLSITDVISLTSKFIYDTSTSFITSMSTPYGVTSFERYVPDNGATPSRGLRIVYPDQTRVVLENYLGEPKISYFWDREATDIYPSDPANKVYTHCQQTRWTIDQVTQLQAPAPQWTKNALENSLMAYSYPNATDQRRGSIDKPSAVTEPLGPQNDIATVSGTITPGDVVSIGISSPFGGFAPSYTVVTGDSLKSIATNLASVINSSTALQPTRVVAVASGPSIYLSSDVVNASTVNFFPNNGATTEQITIKSAQKQSYNIALSGTVVTGETHSFSGFSLPTISYTNVAGDTLTSIAASFAALVNANTTYQSRFITATSSGPVIYFTSFDWVTTQPSVNNSGSYVFTLSAQRNGSNQVTEYQYNSLGKVTQSMDPMNRTFSYQYAVNNIDLTQITETQLGNNRFIGGWTYDSHHCPLTYTDGSGQVTHYTYNSSEQLLTVTDANSNVTTMTYTGTGSATIGGVKTTGNILTISVHDAGLSGGVKAINYTVLAGDTLTTIAAGLAAAITADTSLAAIGLSASSASTTITLKSNSVNVTTYTQSTSGGATETITLGANTFGYLTKIDGPMAGNNDITTFGYDSYGRLSSTTDSEGYTISSSFDNANRLTQTLYPDGSTEQIAYDRLDAVLQKDRIGRTTQDAYDSMQQHAYQIDPLGRKTVYTWCDCGSLSALTDPMGRVTSWHHDLQGRPISKVYADGTAVNYVYDQWNGRLRSKTDALAQKTNYMYNADDTQEVVGYLNSVNPTSSVAYAWDQNYKRLASVAKPDWGTYTYTYNNYIAPGGTATTGGGMLSLVHNDVIPNSDISYSYDVLGRTSNRSINGATNSITWSYDAMSRITQEANALGTFAYAYVDNVTGSSKGTTRLSSISYPNSQVTNFNWYANIGDQRLQQISNLNPTGGTLSQFNYNYDSAGQITQWEQQQNGGNLFYNLGYDAAGQLTTAQAGSGSPQSPFAKEFYYGYDPASNRTSVQTNSISTARIGGTKTTGNVLTITTFDPALTGGSEAVSYTVLAGDTLATIAQGLATAINNDAALRTAGITANANGSNTYINIKSASNNITTYTSSVTGTETISFGIFKNGLENIVIGGTKTTGDIITITVKDAALSGGQRAVTYTTLAGDTLISIATGVKSAINADALLSALGVTATSAAAVVSVTSNSTNATNYASSVSGSASELITLLVNQNQNQLATFGGTKTTGDVITLSMFDSGLPTGKQAVSYTTLAGDTLTSIATGVAAAVNANANLQNSGITATASGTVVTLQSKSPNLTTYRQSFNSTATESMLIAPAKFGWQVIALSGTKTTGNVVGISVFDIGLTAGPRSVNYTVAASDTLTTIATNLAAAINADATLSALGVTATASSTVLSLKSLSPNLTTYATTKSAGATETLSLGTGIGVMQSTYNNVNELKSIAAGGSTFFKGDTDKPVISVTLATPVIDIRAAQPATPTTFSVQTNKVATEVLTVAYTPTVWIFGPSLTATVSGTPTIADVLTLTVFDVRLPSGSETASYTVKSGDTLSTITTGLQNAIFANSNIANLYNNLAISNTQFGLGSASATNAPPNPFGMKGSVTSAGSEIATVVQALDESTTATISGSVTAGDTASVTVQNANLPGGQKTIQYTVVGGDTTTTIATALKNSINSDTALQAVGVQTYSTANVLTLTPYTYYTGSSSGTETVSVVSAARGSAAISIGGSVTTGNTVTITPHNPVLSGGLKNITYTVIAGDTLTSISKALEDLVNADSALKAAGIKVSNSASLAWSQSFSGSALLPTGSALASVTAVDGSSNTKTNGYALSVYGGSTTNLTFDLNGNMLSDGTNAFAWDAENRMTKITYPGTNNFSTFVYDGLSRNVSIVETTAGSVTSTKQFVWSKDRPYQSSEERDSSGTLTKKFFDFGQMNSTTKYSYNLDHLGSVRDMTDNSGVIQAQYSFDPYGRVTKVSETVASDFGYSSYYVHARSGLNLTKSRAYNASLGRFITRDPIEEDGGVNLFAYASNNPISQVDLSGQASIGIFSFCKLFPRFPGCSPKPRCKNSPSSSATPPPPPPPPPPKDDDDEGGHNDNCHADCYADYEKCIKRCQRFINPIRRKLCYEQCATDLGDCYHDCDTK